MKNVTRLNMLVCAHHSHKRRQWYNNPNKLIRYLQMPYKREVRLAITSCSIKFFFLKYPLSNHEYGSCYQTVQFFLFMLAFVLGHSKVFLLFRCFSLIIDVSPSILVCHPDSFTLNRFMNFEHCYTWTTVALILVNE